MSECQRGSRTRAGASAGRALDGLGLRPRLRLLPGRADPVLRGARRRACGRRHILRRVDPVHGGRRPAELARGTTPVGRPGRTGGLVGGDHPVPRDAVLQRHDVPGRAGHPVPGRLRPARVASGRVRVGLLPRLRSHRLPGLGPARLATQTYRAGLVASRGQPAGLHLLRHRRRGRLRRGLEHVAGQPGRGQRHDLRRRRLLPRLRRRHGSRAPQEEGGRHRRLTPGGHRRHARSALF